MKKLLSTLFCLLNIFSIFSAENIIFQSTYQTEYVNNIFIDLNFEQLEIESYFGTEISLIIDSNNLKNQPNISLINDNLNIKSTVEKLKKGDYCKIKVYIPKDFLAKSFSASSLSGKIFISELSTFSYINLKTSSGSISAEKISSPSLDFSSFSGSITADILNSDFFSINSLSGPLEIALNSNPSAFSQIKSLSGSISLFLPKSACIELSANTKSGKISDNISEKNLFSKNQYFTKFGEAGSTLNIQTESGNIRIKSL